MNATEAGAIYRAIRDGFAYTANGNRVKVSWASDGLNHEQLRHWFRDKLDGVINLRAGLRSDGARKRETPCRCRACMHQHAHDLWNPGYAVAGVSARCSACPVPCTPYGRKWEPIWQDGAYRDSRRARERVTRRIRVYQFETEDARKRLGHLLSTWED